MAEISKQALKVDNNQSFPNNNNGAITPSILRAFNTNMIDSMVDEISYNVDSSSWNQQIDALEQFTASASGLTTGSLLVTASAVSNVITFRKGDNSTFNVTVADTTDLSQLNQATASLQAFTASAQVSINNLNTTTTSLNSSVSQLNASSASQQVSINSLNAATGSYVTETESGSFLITASFDNGTRNLTFTKGNNTTFAVNIPDVSGSAGNFVTTSSFNSYTASNDQRVSSLEANSASVNTSISALNTFTASQSTASIVTSITNLNSATASLFTSASLGLVTASAVGNTITFRKGDNSTFNVSVVAAPIDTGSFATTASFNAYTQSNDQRVSSLQSATASLFTSASLALTTASAAGATITFTKGDSTQFSVTVATGSMVSASYAETASFAINAKDIIVDVKNTTGVQINKGTVVRIIGATGDTPLIGTASWTNDLNSANTLGFVVSDIANDAFGRVMTQGSLLSVNTDPALGYTAGQLVYLSSSGQFTNVKPPAPFHEVRLGQVLRAQQNNGSIYVLVQNGYELEELHDVDINTGSLANNNLLAYNSATLQWENKTLTEVGATTTASFNAYTSSNDAKVDSLIARTGSYATTGSNTFTGDQTMIDNAGNFFTITDASGSMVLVAKSYTSASAHISSSANQVNLIWKINDNAVDTIISGSGNIFANQGTITAGFKRYVGGNFNTFPGVTSLPQISGSMGFSPSFATNYIAGAVTMRGPVSSSVWQILQNNIIGTLNLGSSAVLNAEKLTGGFGMSQNYIAGTVSVVANQSFLTGSATLVTGNNINGTATLNLSSSAVTFNNNTINDNAFTLTNQYYSSSVGLGQSNVAKNTIAGTVNQIIISGSQATGTINAPSVIDNILGGGSNIIYVDVANARVSGSLSYNNANRNIIYGQSLIVSGSSFSLDLASMGSAFFGRFNDINGTKDLTAETIFAVGTGNTTTRKTGFLIDSGSNTFIEGTLNISGATSLNGDLNITGSLTASLQQGFVYVGNASGITTTVSTSSFGTPIPTGTISSSAQITSLGFVSSSVTASSLVTASVNLNTITFTKGDSSTFQLTVDTGSGGGGGAAFPFTGDAVITGSLLVSGSSIPDVRVIGNIDLTGSMRVQPVTLSVTSLTASIDMNRSNYFILNLPTSSTTHIAFTNIIPGESINLLVSQSATVATGSVAFAPNIYFPNGSDYQATATGSARDIVSFITFNTNEIYGTQIKNLY